MWNGEAGAVERLQGLNLNMTVNTGVALLFAREICTALSSSSRLGHGKGPGSVFLATKLPQRLTHAVLL